MDLCNFHDRKHMRLSHLFLLKAALNGNHGHQKGNYRGFPFWCPWFPGTGTNEKAPYIQRIYYRNMLFFKGVLAFLRVPIRGFLICYCSQETMGTKKGIPYSFPFLCPWFPFKAALQGTNEKALYNPLSFVFWEAFLREGASYKKAV